MSLYTTLDTSRLVREIESARSHVILAAPGIQKEVAEALIAATKRLSPGFVQVVLDPSAKVARLGYGDFEAEQALANAGIEFRKHNGLRLGVLICDDHGWSFASAARQVEADPTADTEAFNAISLTTAQVLALRGELPSLGSPASQSGKEAERAASTLVVGEELVTAAELDAVTNALTIAPPQQFDLARQTQVYTSLIQFVELTFKGFSIQSRRVQLPATLPMLASQDRDLKARLTASLRVLDKVEQPKELKDIAAALEDLREAYLIPVGPAGRVILKSKRLQFETELNDIIQKLDRCKKGLLASLEEAINNLIASITPELARAVLSDPPPRFRGLFPATPDAAAAYVAEELRKCLPSATDLVDGMRVNKFYKDVTYGVLKEREFMERVLAQIPKSTLDGALLDEFVAAEAGEEE